VHARPGDGPDLDLAQVRAFLGVADTGHFGRAAGQLGLTQQALSKRIARLEAALGVRLLERGPAGAVPTPEGARFLEPARRAVTAARTAVAAARSAPPRRLRLDVWGHLYGPLRSVAVMLDAVDAAGTGTGTGAGAGVGAGAGAGFPVESGAGRDWPAVAAALLRGDIDAGFGRVHALPGGGDGGGVDAAGDGHGGPPGLTRRLVRLEPVDAVLGAGHPLAAAGTLRPADLRPHTLRYPAEPARLDFLTRFADRFGIARRTGGPNLGLDALLARLRVSDDEFTLLPADLPLPADPGLRVVPLVEPTPLYAWSLVWPAGREHPGIAELLRACDGLAARRRWLERDPAREWLPRAAPD
jgi:DNA-binding transcriptional LysR family regulator